jgi:hypothetical protein
MAADVEACSVREWIALPESDEYRVWNRLRQPPASKLGGGEVREGRTRGKHQTPGPELFGEAVGVLISQIKAVRQPLPTGEASMAAERDLSWFHWQLHA